MDWTRILTNVAGEFIAPTTAAYALAAIGLNIHFGLTGLLNMGQAGLHAARRLRLRDRHDRRLAAVGRRPRRHRGRGRLRAHPRHPDAEAARRLPGDRHDRRRRDRPPRRPVDRAHRAHRRRRAACAATSTRTPSRALSPFPTTAPGRSARSSTPTTRPTAGGSGSSAGRVVAARLPARLAPDAQPVGPRAQGHPRGRGRRPLARQERLRATRCRRSSSAACSARSAGIVYVLPRAVQPDSHGPLDDVLRAGRSCCSAAPRRCSARCSARCSSGRSLMLIKRVAARRASPTTRHAHRADRAVRLDHRRRRR